MLSLKKIFKSFRQKKTGVLFNKNFIFENEKKIPAFNFF